MAAAAAAEAEEGPLTKEQDRFEAGNHDWATQLISPTCSTGNKTGLQPVSRPVELAHYCGV